MEVLCVSLRMPATGTVCPRKKAAVVADKVSGRDDQLALPNQLAFQTKFAMLAANAIMLTLNNICSGLNFLSGCGQHCTTVAMPAIKTYFKAYVTSNQIRHIIESRHFTDLATNPVFSTRDYRAVPEKYRALIPEYVKDYVS